MKVLVSTIVCIQVFACSLSLNVQEKREGKFFPGLDLYPNPLKAAKSVEGSIRNSDSAALRGFSGLREAGPGAWNSVCTQHSDCDRFTYCNSHGFCRYVEDKAILTDPAETDGAISSGSGVKKSSTGAKRISSISIRGSSGLREAGPGAWNSVCTQHSECDRFMYCNAQGFCRYAEDKAIFDPFEIYKLNVDGETKSEEGSHAHDASADITDKNAIELKSDEEISCGTDDDCPAYSWCSSDGRCGSWLDLWFQKPLRLSRGKLITRADKRNEHGKKILNKEQKIDGATKPTKSKSANYVECYTCVDDCLATYDYYLNEYYWDCSWEVCEYYWC